jgi:hypothetical protein
MKYNRFDTLTRMISSRRAVGGATAGALASLLGLRQIQEAGAAPCPKGKKRCGEKCIPERRCCSHAQCKPRNQGEVCKRGRCVCPNGTKRCGKRCLPKAAACPPKPDASCAAGGVAETVPEGVRVAVTFTEPNGGLLTAAEFRIQNEPGATAGLYELRLNRVDPATGVPQEVTLALTQRSAASVSETTLTWVRFTFQTPRRLQPGQKYALVLSRVGAAVPWLTEVRVGDVCPDTAVYSSSIDAPLKLQFGLDISYRTFVKA